MAKFYVSLLFSDIFFRCCCILLVPRKGHLFFELCAHQSKLLHHPCYCKYSVFHSLTILLSHFIVYSVFKKLSYHHYLSFYIQDSLQSSLSSSSSSSSSFMLSSYNWSIWYLNIDWFTFQLVIIGTFLICTCFFSVYAMAVDTLFLCFCK